MEFPPELLNQVGVVLEVVVAVLTALTVAFWISLAIWTFRDIRSRTRDFFAWLLAVLLVLGLGPIGLLLYLLLRPKETLAEVYDRQLEEEALLRDITARRACPSCQAVTEADWLICPHCRTELRRTCASCGKPLELSWVACPFCATAVGKARPAGNGHYAQPGAYEPATISAAAAPAE
jgi:RNA polymerase subunit RPABC4/transcription elongation factor Spt4